MKKAVLLFILLTSTTFIFAQYPTVNTHRPRIWIDSARFAELHDLIAVPGEAQDTYNEVEYAYNNWWINDPQLYLLGSDSTLWTWDWSSIYAVDEALLTLFFYKMTNDPVALKRCRFIASQTMLVIESTDYSNMEWYEKETLLRQLSNMDMLLDQCYDNFPVSLRDSLTQSLYAMNREYMNTYILSSSGDSYVSSHNTWNTIICNQNVLTLYHAAGLTNQQKDTVNQWYEALYDKLNDEFIPCWTHYRDDDGGWNWGAAYAMWSLVDQFQLFENMRIGTNKNFYTDLPWVKTSINQYVYFIQPDNKCLHLGDGQMSLSADRTIYLHARQFNDPTSLWMAQYYAQEQFLTWTNPKFQKLLYKDFTAPIVSQPYLPLNWWADKVGLSVSRSSWDKSSTMVSFFNSPSKKAAHEHRDNNSFTIFKHKELLLDAGYYDAYGSEHYRNYYHRSIAHNTICVYDSSDTYLYYGEKIANDGGQIESLPLMNYNDIFLPENQRGKWLKYASGANYTYNIADAQLSYDTTKLDLFRRRLLFIKPEKVIVLDHVHLKNTSVHQRDIKWIAHFENKPIISGNLIHSEVPGHIETYDGSTCWAENGGGNLAIKTLFPSNSNTTLIGGDGYEYWVDGVNYPPLVSPDPTYYTSGKWRIETRPNLITDTIVYLHTIDIGDSTKMAIAGGLALQSLYSIGTDWNDTLYFFANDAEIGKEYHVFNNISGNRTIGLFATDLLNGIYDIKVNGVIKSTVATDEHGILQASTSLSSGIHTIEIVPNTTSTSEIHKIMSFTLYPNPSYSELNIALPSSQSPFKVNIYDVNGKLVMKIANQIKIDISSLSSGLYYIQLIQAENDYRTKFIKLGFK